MKNAITNIGKASLTLFVEWTFSGWLLFLLITSVSSFAWVPIWGGLKPRISIRGFFFAGLLFHDWLAHRPRHTIVPAFRKSGLVLQRAGHAFNIVIQHHAAANARMTEIIPTTNSKRLIQNSGSRFDELLLWTISSLLLSCQVKGCMGRKGMKAAPWDACPVLARKRVFNGCKF